MAPLVKHVTFVLYVVLVNIKALNRTQYSGLFREYSVRRDLVDSIQQL